MTDPLALALRELRGSANDERAGHVDAEDADTLHRILLGLGWFVAPIAPDDALRQAVHHALAADSAEAGAVQRGIDLRALARAHTTDERIRARDHLVMRTMQQHLAAELAAAPDEDAGDDGDG